jgi:wyosine [tRNA(Phe)-imidazoG37] synthetase (radical SAM superfamily)
MSGSGEPTLNLGFGNLIRVVSENWPDIPVAALTSGSI